MSVNFVSVTLTLVAQKSYIIKELFWKYNKMNGESNLSTTRKKCVAGTKKHIAVPNILLTILTIYMADIT